MSDSTTVKLQVKMPSGLKTELDRAAEEKKSTASEIIRLALVNYLGIDNKLAHFEKPEREIDPKRESAMRRRAGTLLIRQLKRTNPALIDRIMAEIAAQDAARKAATDENVA